MEYEDITPWFRSLPPVAVNEKICCAINNQDEIQWVAGSSSKTRYFKTDRYLKTAVSYHNKYHPDDPWRVAKFMLLCVEVEEL